LLFIEFSPQKLQQQTHKQHQLLPREPGNQKLFGDKLSQALTRVLEPEFETHFLAKRASLSVSQKDRKTERQTARHDALCHKIFRKVNSGNTK